MEVTDKDVKKVYDHFEEKLGRVTPNIQMLRKYNPEAMMGFSHIRNSTMYDPPQGALSKAMKEIIITAVEVALKCGADGHARAAIRAGATVEELHEAISMVLWLAGMTTYAAVGRKAIEAAEDEYKKLHGDK